MFWKKVFGGTKKGSRMDIDILVLGNRGAGKTSLLATTLYNINGLLQSNGIVFEPADEDTKRRLENSISEIENMFISKGIIEVGEGISGTDGFIDYKFLLSFSDDSWDAASDFSIVFHDYAGSILANGSKDKQYELLKQYFLKSQIVYILIDTPYLMEATRKTVAEYSAKDEILALFQRMGEESTDKMIAIVPTKCEYYLRNDKASEVIESIRIEFKELLSYISQLNKTENGEKYKLYITPVQTVGGLEFCKMEDREGRQVATFRRTKPNSQFKPVNTDLLLLFCLNYLFGCFFEQLAGQVIPRNRNAVTELILKLDEEKVLSSYGEKYHNYRSEKNAKNKEKTDGELAGIFNDILYAFFSEYSKRELKIDTVCKRYEEIYNCHVIFKGKKKLEDNFGKQFRQQFTQLYL